jgi:hypothetical protein
MPPAFSLVVWYPALTFSTALGATNLRSTNLPWEATLDRMSRVGKEEMADESGRGGAGFRQRWLGAGW